MIADPSNPRHADPRWAVVRLLLGLGQMFGASTGLWLVLRVGVTGITIGVLVATTVLTGTSILLFGVRMPRRGL
jgi:hypothetical protein